MVVTLAKSHEIDVDVRETGESLSYGAVVFKEAMRDGWLGD